MPSPLKITANGILLSVKLQPRSSRNEVGDCAGEQIKIRVTAPPVDSAANLALIELLAETLDVSKSSIQLVRGQTSRHKTVLITGITEAQALARLEQKG